MTTDPHSFAMYARVICTDHWRKPIPFRGCDWVAWFDGEEEFRMYGHGETEREAIDDLVEQSLGDR